MEWRNLFDMKLGFGGLRLPIKGDEQDIDYRKMCEMADTYMENGGKYFDTSYIYHNGRSESAMAACVVDRIPRDRFCLADKLPSWNSRGKDSLEEVFRDQLNKCHTDYFDFYLIHNINQRSIRYVEEHDAFGYLERLKKAGDIRFGGFSFHDTPEMLDRLLTEHKEVDFVQLHLNYYDWLSNYIQAKKCYEIAAEHDVPVIVMQTVRGGGLSNLPPEAELLLRAVQPEMSPSSFAVRFAAGLDQVMMVLSGMSTLEQVQDNCAYMKPDAFVKLSDAEYEALDQVRMLLKAKAPYPCDGCTACEEVCRKHIPIAKIASIYNDEQIFGDRSFPGMHYNIHTEHKGRAGDCDGCGACLKACSKKIPIVELLQKASACYDPKDA